MSKAKDADIPIAYLRERFSLEGPGLTWRARPRSYFTGKWGEHEWRRWNTRYAGKPAGTLRNDGYRIIKLKIDGRKRNVSEHRVIVALTKGEWPLDQVDHENRKRADNKIDNLREATHGEQQQNKDLGRNNKSGFKGVHWNREKRKWRVRIDNSHLGYFDTLAEARDIRSAAEMALHPFRVRPQPIDPLKLIPDGVAISGCWSIEGKMRRVPHMDKPSATSTDTTIFTYDEVSYV